MNDILPEEAARWQRVEATFRRHAELYGYAEVRTPLIEQTELFVRQIGETTDVVEKEMYSFERHSDALTVRPEGTAGAARAYVEHAVHAHEPVTRWYYLGPMFRGERPAKGRYRQFHQLGCELFGDPGPLCDAEMIELVESFLRKLGITAFRTHVNSLGSGDTRQRYKDALVAYLAPHRESLSEDSQRRLEKNPLRVLDSKDPRDREIVAGAPSILSVLDEADTAHFDALKKHLDALGVDYLVDPTLVRGLDYYTRTLFEVRATTADLGAQNALGGGGRYDNMVEGLGGPKTPAVGFSIGVERLLLSVELPASVREPSVYIAPLGPTASEHALPLARALRAADVVTEVDGRGRAIKAMLRRADAVGARLCVILGPDELARGVVSVRDLGAHSQEEVALDAVARTLTDRLRASAPSPPADEGRR